MPGTAIAPTDACDLSGHQLCRDPTAPSATHPAIYVPLGAVVFLAGVITRIAQT
jgi:hypothetical protein